MRNNMKGVNPKRGRKRSRRRQSGEDSDVSDEPIYCICQKSHCDTFMIACDACQEWYHGECINVSAKQAEYIEKFYCQSCRDKDSSLNIEFKNDHSNGKQSFPSRQRSSNISSPLGVESDDEVENFVNIRSRKRGRKHTHPIQPRSRPAISVRRNESSDDDDDDDGMEVIPSQFASPSSAYSQSNSVPGSYSQRQSKYGRMTPPGAFDAPPATDAHWRRMNARNSQAQQCGECEGCKRTVDCGSCEVCRTPKLKQSRSRHRCYYRTCIGNDLPNSRRGRVRTSSKISPTQSQLSDFDYDSHFDDYSSSRRFMSGTSKGSAAIGSKMRRGDHLPGGLGSSRHIQERGMEPHFSRRGSFGDVSMFDGPEFGAPYGVLSAHRDRNGSRYGSSHHPMHAPDIEPSIMRDSNELLDPDALAPEDPPANYESDEDVVLPEMRPCSGPACSKPAIRSRYCSEECQLRHESNTMQRPLAGSRLNNPKEQILTPYALPYPDHLYCKHHRMHNSHSYGIDSNMPLQQPNSSIPDVMDIYEPCQGPFGGSNQSGNVDFLPVYDQVSGSQMPGMSNYRRISNHGGSVSVNSDFSLGFNSYSQGNHASKSNMPIVHSRQMLNVGNFDELRVDRGRSHLPNSSNNLSGSVHSSRGGGRMLPVSGRQQQLSNTDSLPPELSLDSITPTVRPMRMYNGQITSSHVASDYRVGGISSDVPQGDAGTELLSADTTDLLDVDGNSSSGIGPAPSSSGASAFRQGDDYYMMNENENMEINWPTSPSGVVTASAGTV